MLLKCKSTMNKSSKSQLNIYLEYMNPYRYLLRKIRRFDGVPVGSSQRFVIEWMGSIRFLAVI